MLEKTIGKFNIEDYEHDKTVVTKFCEAPRVFKMDTELALENSFVTKLENMGYELIKITTPEELKSNLRNKITELNIDKTESLNNKSFTNEEWERFYATYIANSKEEIIDKTRRIQEHPVVDFKRDDDSLINITLFDKKNPQENKLQVMHQYSGNNKKTGAKKDNRYDVTILINGLPIVHIELKKPGVNIKEAYNQIDRYQRDSFDAGDGLFKFVEIFIISNGVSTRYYPNTLRIKQVGLTKTKRKIGTFEETSIWSDGQNTIIDNLENFSATFLKPDTIRKIVAKYCILNTEDRLIIMRPHQIYAAEQIVHMVEYINKNNKWGVRNDYPDGSYERPGGFVWHATGSGKTLTSFKTSMILGEKDFVDAIVFAVDRRDLYEQSEREFNNYKKDSVDGTEKTEELRYQLKECADRKTDKKVVVTTIQKLSNLITKYDNLDIYDKNVVFIFDECHRSQFGEMHRNIRRKFKKTAFFGFTGTPIMAKNSREASGIDMTATLFGKCLHKFLTGDAQRRGNVLPWRIQTIKNIHENIKKDDYIFSIDEEKVFLNEERIKNISNRILRSFDALTYRNQDNGRMCGMLAVESIKEARLFYETLKELQKDAQDKINIATIFTANPNEEDVELNEDTVTAKGLDKTSIEFLNETAISDYNKIFGKSFNINKFYDYYKDLSKRVRGFEGKDKLNAKECVDLVIVVNMLTTGFDAPRLNTIWIDKHIKYHGLFQLISRVNRPYGPLKKYGNIYSFRGIEKELNGAIALFCDTHSVLDVCLRPYEDYLNGYSYTNKNGILINKKGFLEIIKEIKIKFPYKSESELEEATYSTKEDKESFANLFNEYLRTKHIISSFDEYKKEEEKFFSQNKLFSEQEEIEYRAKFYDIRDSSLRKDKENGTDVSGDLCFEEELAKQYEIDKDYIIDLIKNTPRNEIEDRIEFILRKVNASSELRPKKELIKEFLERAYRGEMNPEDAEREYQNLKQQEIDKNVNDLIDKYGLKEKETRKLVEEMLEKNYFDVSDTKIPKIMNEKFGLKTGNEFAENLKNIKNTLKEIYDTFY